MIYVNNLVFTYPGNKEPTLKGIDFQVRKGEIFGFLGPSGSGKSTTQNLLIGLYKQYGGVAKVFDTEVHLLRDDYYEKIGVGFELPNHYQKMTALENLNFFRSLYRKKTKDPEEILQLLGLLEDKDKRVSDFSKGMQMRLNIARALIHDPDLLFMDEPTTGLDPVNARRVKDIIFNLKQEGKTIFLTTHNMNVADELCDRVAFIVDGQISLIDSPKALKLQYGEPVIQVTYLDEGMMKTEDFVLDGLGNNPDFLQFIKSNKLKSIHTKEATLESIFIEVTGRELV
ncbi:ABC transporter ATP-binding protein [Bacillus solimangrovi]|uniref:ABC transporter ATP-binding protein n=1 Tax=Bacillus solimangrovi TaxID=1305675 RepID=A0A1E5LJY5_9BACI|nr:ABC transporter ATP-binding protein [Bacillus solimangrovi]OEH94346.1 ABC transporter ATP-binding protein [Bacillus solimangrovi]